MTRCTRKPYRATFARAPLSPLALPLATLLAGAVAMTPLIARGGTLFGGATLAGGGERNEYVACRLAGCRFHT